MIRNFLLAIMSFYAPLAALSDVEYPNEFYVIQDSKLGILGECQGVRVFRVMDKNHVLGSIFSSEYAVLDFYNSNNIQLCKIFHDSILDNEGFCVGTVKDISDEAEVGWFEKVKTNVEVYSETSLLVGTVKEEILQNCFFFRDAETNQTLAIAIWGRISTDKSYFSFLNTYVQGWSIVIIDRAGFKEKGIPVLYLVGALMKHSQRNFENPYWNLPYVKNSD